MYSAEEIYRVRDYLNSIRSEMETYKAIEDIERRKQFLEGDLCFMLFIVSQLLPEEIKEEITNAHRLYIRLTPYQGK